MKRLVIFIWSILVVAGTLHAQTEQNDNRMDDKERIALTPIVLDDAIPAGAQKQLVNKMTQVAAKNGCAATGNSRFIITCSVDVLTKDITPTAPPMHAYTVNINFFVGDGVEGRLFSSTTIEAKGVGQTPDKAYINALKNVRVNDPAFKMMIDQGKRQIIEYYNTNCDLILAEAKAMEGRQEYTAAISLLTSVPNVCEECYQKALDASVAVYQAWRDQVCAMALNKAQAAWATRDSKAAAEALEAVPTDGACVEDAKALRKSISASLDAKEKQEWDFKTQQYEDRMEQERQQRLQQARQGSQVQQGVSAQQSSSAQPTNAKEQVRSAAIQALQVLEENEIVEKPKPTYKVKGKWFK